MFPVDSQSQKRLTSINTASPTEGCGTILNQTKSCIKCFSSFALNTGATSTGYNLNDDQGNAAILPYNSYVTNVVAVVLISLATSASGALALTSQLGTADLMAAKTTLTAGTLYAGAPVGTSATWVGPVTAKSGNQIQSAISVGALTAFSVEWICEFVIA